MTMLVFRSYLDKKISLHLNKGRKVSGTLRGYDQFMNIVLGDAVNDGDANSKDSFIGMVVSNLEFLCILCMLSIYMVPGSSPPSCR